MSIYFRRDKILYTDFSCLSSIPFCIFNKEKKTIYYKKEKIKDINVILFLKEKLQEEGIEIRSLKDFSEEFGLPRWYEISKTVYLDYNGNLIDLSSSRRASAYASTLCKYFLGKKGSLRLASFTTDKQFIEEVLKRHQSGYKPRNRGRVVDHIGNTFPTKKEMCEYWGISNSFLNSKTKEGWDLEKILTSTHRRKVGVEYDGKYYPTRKALADELGVSFNRLRWFLDNDKPLSEIVKEEEVIRDHLGNEFKSHREMCKCYGLNDSTFFQRLKKGWSLEKSLTYPTKIKVRDHLGNEFNSYKEMASYWGISIDAYNKRKRNGWSLKDSLTVPINENLRRLPKKKD